MSLMTRAELIDLFLSDNDMTRSEAEEMADYFAQLSPMAQNDIIVRFREYLGEMTPKKLDQSEIEIGPRKAPRLTKEQKALVSSRMDTMKKMSKGPEQSYFNTGSYASKTDDIPVKKSKGLLYVVIEPIHEASANVLGAFTNEHDADHMLELLWDRKSPNYSPNAFIDIVTLNPDIDKLLEDHAMNRKVG